MTTAVAVWICRLRENDRAAWAFTKDHTLNVLIQRVPPDQMMTVFSEFSPSLGVQGETKIRLACYETSDNDNPLSL